MTVAGWTSPADVAAKVRRRWDDGSLLGLYAARAPFPVVDVPLRGPRPSEIGERLADVQAWVASVEAGGRGGRRYDVQYADIGGRAIGRNRRPDRAVVSSYDQAWALLGVASEVATYEEVLAVTSAEPTVHAWVSAHPFKALDRHPHWPQLLAAYAWLDRHRGHGLRLRTIDAPGVDTKFVDRHRSVLASLLGVPGSQTGFASGLGLAAKPEMVRVRFDEEFMGLPRPLSEATFVARDLARVQVSVRAALIVENEATFLSVDVPREGLVIWGKGFEVDRAGSLPFLADADVTYWGDLDTHGFAILNRLRAWLPQARSVLMDRGTLLEHRNRWVVEDRPTRARLTRLDRDESALYDDLLSDRLGDRVRLEQERIAWDWAMTRLPDYPT